MGKADNLSKREVRGRSGKASAQVIKRLALEERALTLRACGMSYAQIALDIVVSEAEAYRLVEDSLTRHRSLASESRERARDLELLRLDMAMRGIASRVQEGDLDAIDRWLRVSSQRSKLAGLDSPDAVDLSIHVSMTPTDRIESMRDRLRESAEVSTRRRAMLSPAQELPASYMVVGDQEEDSPIPSPMRESSEITSENVHSHNLSDSAIGA